MCVCARTEGLDETWEGVVCFDWMDWVSGYNDGELWEGKGKH